MTNSSTHKQTDALQTIAAELIRLRALKEYELGVTTTTHYPEHAPVTVVAGQEIKDKATGDVLYAPGDAIWDEDSGLIAE